jgi:membrane-bound serine protease (ClpP class)
MFDPLHQRSFAMKNFSIPIPPVSLLLFFLLPLAVSPAQDEAFEPATPGAEAPAAPATGENDPDTDADADANANNTTDAEPEETAQAETARGFPQEMDAAATGSDAAPAAPAEASDPPSPDNDPPTAADEEEDDGSVNVDASQYEVLYENQTEQEFQPGDVMIIPMRGEINGPNEAFLRRMLKEAERRDASAFIIDMDTFGGRLDSTMEMVKTLNRTDIPTFTLIDPNAASAGSIIAIATDFIYMAPGSALGAAEPVAGGQDLPEAMRRKTLSYYPALIRDTAVENGHNPEIAEAFMDPGKEVKVGGEMISEEGDLLTLSAREATRVIDGKPLLAEAVVDNLEELAAHANLRGQLFYFRKTPFEVIGFYLAVFAPILLLAGIAGAYLEFQVPGFGIPGLISMISFGLFFFGQHIVGLAGSELIVFFILGVVLLAVEIFVLPGSFIFGISGLLLMLGTAFFAMVDTWPTDFVPEIGSFDALVRPIVNMGIALIGAVIIAILAGLYLPRSPFFDRIALSNSVGGIEPPPPAGDTLPESPATAGDISPGKVGLALHHLRPTGKASFDDGQVIKDVISSGKWIERGSELRVLRVSGNRILVEPVEPSGDEPAPDGPRMA